MPDPNLVKAADEIEAIMRKYDCMGVAVLASPTNAQFVTSCQTSWSCATHEGNSKNGEMVGVRIRCRSADFPNEEAKTQCLANTLTALTGIQTSLTGCAENLGILIKRVAEKSGVEMTIEVNNEPPQREGLFL